MIALFNILFALLFSTSVYSKLDISSYLAKELSDCNRIDYTIVSPKYLTLSMCEIDNSREIKIAGSFAYIPVKQKHKNGTSKNYLITLRLKLYKNVLVANRNFLKKENLRTSDFHVVEREVSTLRYEPVNISFPIEDFRSRLKISENSILQKSMLEKIPDIAIGDRVEAMFLNNSVSISFSVTARSEGTVGEIIKIKNDDKKIFKARIINNSTVKIIE